MSLIVTEAGARALLDALTNQLGAFMDSAEIHLFQNNLTPTSASVLGDFTEADFDGYAAQNLTTWSPAVTVSGHARTGTSVVSWIPTGSSTSNDIYGYYILLAGILIGAERDPGAPITVASPSDSYSVAPTFTGVSEF